jgi:hypothetical protein
MIFFFPIWRKQKSAGIKRMRAAIADERCASNAVYHASSTFARWCLRENMKLKKKKAARIYDEGSPSVSRNWCVLGTSMYYYKVNCRLLFTPVATQTRREITFSPLFRVKIKSDQQRVQPPSIVLTGIYTVRDIHFSLQSYGDYEHCLIPSTRY